MKKVKAFLLEANPAAHLFSIKLVDTFEEELSDHDDPEYFEPNTLSGLWYNQKKEAYQGDVNKGLDLTNVKSIYFTPKCNVPRDRARQLFQKHGISIVRDYTKADVVITSKDYGVHSYISDHETYVSTQGVKHYLSNFKDTCNAKEILAYIDSILATEDVKYCILKNRLHHEYLYEHEHLNPSYHQGYGRKNYDITASDFGGRLDRNSITYVNYDYLLQIPEVKAKTYDERELLTMMGETVIDKDAYESLYAMLDSMDKDNHMMAMTIMANCNYEGSFMYLAKLFLEFGSGKIYNHTYRTSVAFKALTSWMGYNGRGYFNYDNILDLSIEKDVLTQEMLEFIKAGVVKESTTAGNEFFEITNVKLSPEGEEKVNQYFKQKGYVNGLPSGTELLQQEVSL